MHELVLNGIGGSTIAEAKANITYSEVLAWSGYRDKHGSLNPMRRFEFSSALIALQVNRANGGEADLYDFMPNVERPAITLEQAMREWG
ncbi:phage tail assembly protein T [Pseudomonas viridiflava]|uniref:phage tail assembly protein T n=1 Tax=Pseudomonas viridiflava TaxID=33069 RepID=UPI000F037C9C|nr:hypothetical protein [Pseudomonas viridiflava]